MRLQPAELSARIGDRLFLNAFAILGAVLGLANTGLAWRIYGTGADGDLWMMAITITQAFNLLSQLGVEQVAIYSTEARARSESAGRQFDGDSLTWAVCFGLGFASVVALGAAQVATVFAKGFSSGAIDSVTRALIPLLLQVAVAPGLFVLRQQLLLKGRARLSILLNNTFGAVLLLSLSIVWWVGGSSPDVLSRFVGPGSAALAIFAILAFGERGACRKMPQWAQLRPFIRASIELRLTHSVHNFLVVLLTNAALSAGVAGTVAMFQYVKKVAEGLSSISIGPHLSVYHVAQARAWTQADATHFVVNIRRYLNAALPLLAAATLLFLAAAALGIEYVRDSRLSAAAQQLALLLLLLGWQVVIAVESVPAGVLVLARRPGLLLLVNVTYVLAFYSWVNWLILPPYGGAAVASASLGCQLISLALFVMVAKGLHRKRFGEAVHA